MRSLGKRIKKRDKPKNQKRTVIANEATSAHAKQ